MKQKRTGTIIGTICIVAFLILIVTILLFTKQSLDDEKAKKEYYSHLYGLDQIKNEIVNEPIKYPSQEYLVDENSATYKAIAKLRLLHSQADYFLMGGRINNYSSDAIEAWQKIEESSFLQLSEYEQIAEAFQADENITKDMSQLLSLLKITIENKNADAMKYMHRILHDIDLYGFPAQGATASDYWGATYSVPSSDSAQLEEITKFISDHTAAQ